jgi:outer membrane lipoprotein-sorting protein
MMRSAFLISSCLLIGLVIPAHSQTLSAEQIIEQSQQAFYAAGTDMKAKVVMDLIADNGNRRTRVLTMLRKNDAHSKNQKYFLYFHEPGDVRGTAFLVWKYPDRDSDRWIFIPAVNMVRRIAAKDSRSSFVGSDFSYEDVSGRNVGADTHTLVREEKLGDFDCYVIQSVPKTGADYTRKLSWIDKKTFLPLKEEYYDAQSELARVFTADKVEVVGAAVKSYPTVTKRTMKNLKSGHRTEVTFSDVTYSVGIEDRVFTQQSLESPPGKWIR